MPKLNEENTKMADEDHYSDFAVAIGIRARGLEGLQPP